MANLPATRREQHSGRCRNELSAQVSRNFVSSIRRMRDPERQTAGWARDRREQLGPLRAERGSIPGEAMIVDGGGGGHPQSLSPAAARTGGPDSKLGV